MAKVGINTGTAANAGDGSTLRAGANIVNGNFDEIYNKSKIDNLLFKNYLQTFHCFDNNRKGSEKIIEIIKQRYF